MAGLCSCNSRGVESLMVAELTGFAILLKASASGTCSRFLLLKHENEAGKGLS